VRLRLSADPHFRGDAALLNPEQLVVLAASSCLFDLVEQAHAECYIANSLNSTVTITPTVLTAG
jgi:organic hydroperoxide reductase OsmC/OhrA